MKDAIIILGMGIKQNGSLPERPKQSVEEGVRLWKGGIAKKIIMSGNYTFLLDGIRKVPPRSEAEAMREYAESLGVPSEDIFIEKNSKDTIGNAYFTKINLLEINNWKDIVVVAHECLIPRTKIIFKIILGSDYHIEFAPVLEHLTRGQRTVWKMEEMILTTVLRWLLGNTKPGETEKIRNILYKKHPGYIEV